MDMLPFLKVASPLLAALAPAPFLGRYLAKVYAGERHALSFLAPTERWFLRAVGSPPGKSMTWIEYLGALLAFNAAGIIFLQALLMTQAWLPLNPRGFGNMGWLLALNTAVSFVTNTNWQAYAGEASLSVLSQSIGLATQNFASAATGAAVAAALARSLAPRLRARTLDDVFAATGARTRVGEMELVARHLPPAAPADPRPTVGNFWLDLWRSFVYVLLPLSLALSLVLASQGVPQTFSAGAPARTMEGAEVTVPLGPVASQVAIKQVGSNGGGYFGTNSAHPLENPTPLSNFCQAVAILLLPAAFPFMFGRKVGDPRQGRAIFGAMAFLLAAAMALALVAERSPNPVLGGLPFLEGKETRIGTTETAFWAAATTAVSNGSVNGMHGSASPALVLVAIVNIVLGEVVFGGVGAGLYGMFLFVVLAVFLAGLMVGRSPEYLGRKVEVLEVRWAMIGVIVPSMAILGLSALALALPAGRASILNAGPRGLSEVLYAASSAAGNNGSALAGLAANVPFWNVATAAAMLAGRYVVIAAALGVAGSLAGKRVAPEGAGTFDTGTATFAALLVAVVLVVGGLTFLPALALGPGLEGLLAAGAGIPAGVVP